MRAPGERKLEFNAALNGYRGLCALLVFIFHVGSAGIVMWPSGSALDNLMGNLWYSLTYGVEMFFMISGFVILGSLLRHRTISGFLQDRAIRIFSAWIPALCAVTAVCLLMQIPPLAGRSAGSAAALFVGNLFLLPPIVRFPMIHQVSWSLSYEWVFYITAAAGLLIYRRATPRQMLLAAWFTLGAMFIVLFPRALFFLSGVIVFYYRDWFAQRAGWLRFPVASFLVFLLAWEQTGAFKAHLNDTIFDFVADGRIGWLVIAFVASLHMFASVTLNATWQTHFLCGRVFQFLGNISYSFYLWHALVMALFKRGVQAYVVPDYGTGVGVAVFVISSLLVALPVSWISWRLFEVHFAASLRNWLRRREAVEGGAVRAA